MQHSAIDGTVFDDARLRQLVQVKQQELHDASELRIAALEAALAKAQTVNTTERERFHSLKNDFEYNLKLIDERDAELARFDSQFAQLTGTLAARDAQVSELMIALDRTTEEVARQRAASNEQRLVDASRHEELFKRADTNHAALEEAWCCERDQLNGEIRELRRRLNNFDEDAQLHRHEFDRALQDALAQRDRETLTRTTELIGALASAEDLARRAARDADACRLDAQARTEECRAMSKRVIDLECNAHRAESAFAERESELRSMITTLETALEGSRGECVRTQQNLESLRSQLADATCERERAVSSVAESAAAREDQLRTALTEAREATARELAAANERAWVAEDRCRALEAEVGKLHAGISEARAVVEEMYADRERIGAARDTELTGLRDKCEKLAAQRELALRKAMNERAREGEERRRALEAEVVKLRAAFSQACGVVDEVQSERKHSDAASKKELSALRDKCDRRTAQREQAVRRVRELEETIMALRKERARKLTDTATSPATSTSHSVSEYVPEHVPESGDSGRVVELEAQNGRLRSVIAEMRGEMERMSAEIGRLSRPQTPAYAVVQPHSRLRRSLEHAVQDIRRLIREREKLVDINNSLRAEIDRMSVVQFNAASSALQEPTRPRPSSRSSLLSPLYEESVRIPSPGSLLSGLDRDDDASKAECTSGGPDILVIDHAGDNSARALRESDMFSVEGRQHSLAERHRPLTSTERHTIGQRASRAKLRDHRPGNAGVNAATRTVRNYNLRDVDS